jgi:hypothetical protein
LKRAVEHLARKKRYLPEIEKFEKFDELTRKYLRWKRVV